MTNFNKVIQAGFLVRDPEVRTTQGGTTVCKFTLANNRTWVQNGEKKETALFIDCSAFGKTGEVIGEHFKKGSRILLEGRLQLEQWDDKESGAKKSKISIFVENFQFVDQKAKEAAPKKAAKAEADYNPEIPF